MKDGLFLLAFALILVLAIILPIAFAVSVPDRIACHARWAHSGYTTDYGMWSGCKVQINGAWLPERAVRVPL
jgi:hypothetical protein